MAGLFRSGRTNKTPPATGIRVTTSLQGQPRAIVWGQTRIPANLIDYAGFTAKKTKTSGGKGGLAGGGGKGSSGTYDYSASVIASLGEAIADIKSIYNSSAVDFLGAPSATTLAALSQLGIVPTYGNTYNIEIHYGGAGQAVSSYWNGAFPARVLSYPAQAYVVFPNLALGNSPSFPNFNFEVLGVINSDIPSLGPDANPADIIQDVITNANYGVYGFPSGLNLSLAGSDVYGLADVYAPADIYSDGIIGDFATARNYWRAAGLLVSTALSTATAANAFFTDMMKALNAEFRWSNGLLDIVPFGDVAITGNGYAFTPNLTPQYDLGLNDYLPNVGSLGASGSGTTTVAFSRKNPNEVFNRIPLEYLDRNTLYNPAVVYAADDAAIAQRGLKQADKRSNHFFNLASAASASVSLQLHRELAQIMAYQVTVPRKYARLEPLDLVTITEPALQLYRKLVRITEIQENADKSRTLTFEEVPGTAAAPAYGQQAHLGAGRNSNAPAGMTNPPFFFEPPDQLGNGLVLWMGLSGAVPANWGGCDVWASTDGQTYTEVGTFTGSSRMGVLSAALASVTASPSGATIDTVNTLAVDLSMSLGSLANASAADLIALNTAIAIDKEILAYQNATLTAANKYNLTTLSRGGFSTMPGAHAAGAVFLRLDGQTFNWPFTSDRVGKTVYFKFVSFNPFGGGRQQLSDVGAYPYLLTGSALASALPNVQNLRSVFEAGVQKVWWDEITDFRPILYEVRKGSTWATALPMGTLAHPPFVAHGDDTFWVAAVTTPAAGLTIYSATPLSVAIQGALLSQNIVRTYDEQATGWTGIFGNGVGTQGINPHAYLLLGGGGNILTNPNILTTPDIIAYGGIIASGTYDIPVSHQVDVGYVGQCLIGATYAGTGTPYGQNILTIANILSMADVLGSASSRYVDVHVEISTALTAGAWIAWQKFVPGVYVARFVKFRIVLATLDPSIIPVCLGFSFQVTVAARMDHYQNLTIPAAGLTITFKPDGAASSAAFNGGPNGAALPYLNATWANQSGDTLVWTVTATQAVVQILNGGTGVTRSGVNINVEGF